MADSGAIPDKPSPAGSASLAGSKEILDRPSLSDCLVSLKKKSEGSNEPEPFNEPGPIVLAQNSMRFYRRLALVLAGVTIALLAFITIDRAERPGPEAWSQEGGFRRES